MKSRFDGASVARALLLAAGMWCDAMAVQAAQAAPVTPVAPVASVAPGPVIPFDETSWAQLLRGTVRPAAFLFTTSYCATCVQAFDSVQKELRARGARVPVNVVMMDVEGASAQHHAMLFQGLTTLYAFDGFEPAIRQSVDPAWPNVTPYMVLIDRRGQLQRVLGQPTATVLKRWLR